ncbi:glycosyltransferase family 4 protein [Akkermansiaceae bacterium]|nr:glycosyltransferase family 4 protein [Akkermansiaceae bacterium]
MKQYRVLIVGNMPFSGKGTSYQGEFLYRRFKADGHLVYKRTKYKNRAIKMLDILFFVLINARKYDIVILKTYSDLSFYIADWTSLLCKILGKKVLFFIQGGKFTDFYQRKPNWCQQVLARGSELLSPSPEIVEHLNQQGIKTQIVPNAMSIDKWPYKERKVATYKLLWVRGFHAIYNPLVVIDAIDLLRRKYPKIHLSMVGPDKGLMQKGKERIAERKLDSHIDVVGPIPNNELFEWYHKFDIYINSTSYESFGLAVLEAALCGIPILSSKVGALPYLWEEKNEIFFSEEITPEAFRDAIVDVYNDYDKAISIAKKARTKAESYDMDVVSQAWYRKFDSWTKTEG